MHLASKGKLLVLGTALISGFSIFLNAYGVKGFDSSVFTFSKNLLVAVLLLGIILALGNFKMLKQLTRKQWLSLAGIGLVGGSIPFLMFFAGLQLTTGSTGAFIHKTLFIWVSVLAILFLKEKLSKPFLAGAALLLAGNFLFLMPSFSLSVGHLLILGATLFWAVENAWSKKVVSEVSGTIVAFGRMFFGSLFILVFLALTSKAPLITSMSMAQYGWVAVTSVLLLGYVFTYYNSLEYINVSTASSVLVLGSPITLFLSFLFRGVSISAFQAAGMVLILVGASSILYYTHILRFFSKLREVIAHGWN